MKKKLLPIALLFVILKGFGNPVIEPPVISEIYLNGEIIQIEFFFQEDYWWWDNSFNDLFLVSSMDTVAFNEGINIIFDEIMVLDQNDLVENLEYNSEGDQFYIIEESGYILTYTEFTALRFGNYPESYLPVPNESQSIAFTHIYTSYGYYDDYLAGIEQPPTIGMNELTINSHGHIMGMVYDLNNNPISEAHIKKPYVGYYWEETYVYTSPSGMFHLAELLCRDYTFLKCTYGDCYQSFSASVNPNDTTWVEIQLDTLVVGIPEYHNHPNPFTGSTSFNIQIPDNLNYNSANVCIYNMSGKLVDRLELQQNQNSIDWQTKENEPGVYLYNLIVDGKKYATQKMIIL